MAEAPADEMVTGRGGVRPHWRTLLGTIGALGPGALAERAQVLDRAFADEGIATVLPGARASEQPWRCDPLPLPLPAEEFAKLEAGLAQRARLLEALLADLYGPQALLREGLLPPALVFANPGFLRPCHRPGQPAGTPYLHLYAADLLRAPDGGWQVLADHTLAPTGIGLLRENRRLLGRAMPEAFRSAAPRAMRPFFELWQDTLQRIAATEARDPAVAVLTGGLASPGWFEDLLLSRELSCALVEPGDLTVRAGRVFLKTLQGLQHVDLLLSRLPAQSLDPLEFATPGAAGVPGLLDAALSGAVMLLNAAGSAAAEAPGLFALLPALAPRLLGQDLQLPQVPALWLGTPAALAQLHAAPQGWMLRQAVDARAPWRPAIEGLAGDPAQLAALRPPAPSLAPVVGAEGLAPSPLTLRMFLLFDGAGWRCLPGGLARLGEALPDPAARVGGLTKDVWVLSDDRADAGGPAAAPLPPLPIRRTPAALPSRIADNLFWLGRYTERLEGSARLLRAAVNRLNRGVLLPSELAELSIISRCLARAGVIAPEDAAREPNLATLAEAALRTVRTGGTIATLHQQIAALTEQVRDRLTADMHATFTQALRTARQEAAGAGTALDVLYRALVPSLRFSTAVAGLAAENMVRGGGWLFLDLGRRLERAQAVAAEVAEAMDQPPARIEPGLRLALELADSVITYRSRYVTVLQPAPALDLVLADEANPRALAFQLAAMRRGLAELPGGAEAGLPAHAERLLAEGNALVAGVLAAPDQAVAATQLPPQLRALAEGVGALSDTLTRRYFALLPVARSLGPSAQPLRGAA